MLSRRHFLGASLATTVYAAGAWVPVWAQNAPNLGTPTLPSPGFRRMKVGDVEVIALNDGVARRPLGEEFVKNAPLAEVRALLAAQGLPTDYIEATTIPDVRQAMGAFAARWRDLAERMLRGDKHPEFTVGHPEDQLSVSRLLHNRANILQEFVEDEEAWQGRGTALENA